MENGPMLFPIVQVLDLFLIFSSKWRKSTKKIKLCFYIRIKEQKTFISSSLYIEKESREAKFFKFFSYDCFWLMLMNFNLAFTRKSLELISLVRKWIWGVTFNAGDTEIIMGCVLIIDFCVFEFILVSLILF